MEKRTVLFNTCILAFSTFITAEAAVVINEVDYDQIGTDSSEFIELYNSGPGIINLNDYRLDLINGASNSAYNSFDLSDFSISPGGFFVICANASMVANCNLGTTPDTNMIQNGAAALHRAQPI